MMEEQMMEEQMVAKRMTEERITDKRIADEWAADKKALIKKEVRRLTKILKDVDKNKKDTVKRLIENAAFMAVTLDELQEEINKNGVVSEYKNGENQYGTKKSPEVEVYNTMVKNQMAVIKQLCELAPEEKAGDMLLDFIGGGK